MSDHDILAGALAPIVSRVCTTHHWTRAPGRAPSHINRPLTPARLARHVADGPYCGAAPIAPGESVTRIAVLDLDSHKGETPWPEMQAIALHAMTALEAVDLRPIPFRSSGGAGMHVYLLWDEPQDAYSVRQCLRATLESCGMRDGVGGVARGEVEVFPKQNSVPADGFGSMFVLPLAGAAVPLDSFELDDMPRAWVAEMAWPVSAPVPVVEREAPVAPVVGEMPVGLAVLKSALNMIPNAGDQELDYNDWRNVIFALHHATGGSPDGLALAHGFSARAGKYDAAFIDDRVWPHVKATHDGERGAITARTILKMAREHGWQEPVEADFAVVVAETGAVGHDGDGRQKAYRARTEFGNAERMLDRYGSGLMYVPQIGTWFRWTGVYWAQMVQAELEHLAKETIRALPDEISNLNSDEERLEFFKFCAACQKASMVGNMIRLASSDPRVLVPVTELDRHIHLFGVANGVIDLRTGRLLPPDPAHRITVISPVEYDENAPAPWFERTISDVFFDDAGQIEFFQRLVGYSMLATPKEDVLVIPFGSGANGKSTVLGAVRSAFGGYAKSAGADTFLSSGGGGAAAGAAREDLLRLRGARFVYVSEPEEGAELREGLVKSMTGGDPVPARGMWERHTVELTPTWVAFMPTNHRPIIKGSDHAIWRRLMLVPFTRNFDADESIEKDPERAGRITAELAGVLAWCARGALAYQQRGLRPTKAIAAARESYRTDMDLLADWIDERCERAPDAVTSTEDLWQSWRAFAEQRGELRFIASSRLLGRQLTSRGFLPVKNARGLRGRGFVGISVRDFAEFGDDGLL